MIEENPGQVDRHRDLNQGAPECESRALPRSHFARLMWFYMNAEKYRMCFFLCFGFVLFLIGLHFFFFKFETFSTLWHTDCSSPIDKQSSKGKYGFKTLKNTVDKCVTLIMRNLLPRGWRRVIGISGSLIWSKTQMELIFNPCGEFWWSPEGLISQIQSPHLQAGALGIFQIF